MRGRQGGCVEKSWPRPVWTPERLAADITDSMLDAAAYFPVVTLRKGSGGQPPSLLTSPPLLAALCVLAVLCTLE